MELEIQKGTFDPEDENIIDQIMEKLETWFSKSKMEEGSTSWRGLRDMRRGKNESIHDYIIRYETAESDVKANAGDISDEILVIQLLDSINLEPIERQNILASTKYEDNPNYYEYIKKAINLLKGALVESVKSSEKEDEKSDVLIAHETEKDPEVF